MSRNSCNIVVAVVIDRLGGCGDAPTCRRGPIQERSRETDPGSDRIVLAIHLPGLRMSLKLFRGRRHLELVVPNRDQFAAVKL